MNEARLALLKKYIEEDPNDPFNYYAIATESVLEEPEKTKEYFDFLLEKHLYYLPTYYQAAQLFADFEDYARAESIYKAGIVLAKTQDNQKALRELTTAYQNLLFEMD